MKQEDRRRDKEIRVKVNNSEFDLITRRAEQIGLERSTYLRMLAMKEAKEDGEEQKSSHPTTIRPKIKSFKTQTKPLD